MKKREGEQKIVAGQSGGFLIQDIRFNREGKVDLTILLEDLIIYIDPPRLISSMKIEVSLCNRDAMEVGRKLKEVGLIETIYR